jgi:hypothetical protein
MTNDFNHKQIKTGFLRAQIRSIQDEQDLLGVDSYFCYGMLTHYTNLQGLIGIVESGGYWLSDIRFLNDAKEFEHGRELALELVDKLMSKPRHKSFEVVLQELGRALSQPIQKPHFVASFSRDKDSLEQWRAYASGLDGVALVFENASEINNSFMCEPRMHSSRVIYDEDKKKRSILNAISRFSIEYKKELLLGDQSVGCDPIVWAQHLLEVLTNAFVTFKHHAFRTENEVRVVTSFGQICKTQGKVSHRVRAGRIVPYVSSTRFYTDLSPQRLLPLREVIVGPLAAQSITIESVKAFLANSGYANVPVRPSLIPYRG